VGGGITGMGFRFGIIDDPIKSQKEADSATFRESVWEWYTSTFWTRQEKDARILLTLTRWHEDDLAGRLLDLAASDPAADQWDVLCLPAICEDEAAPYEQRHEGEALWPERYDLRFFAAAYANNPRPARRDQPAKRRAPVKGTSSSSPIFLSCRYRLRRVGACAIGTWAGPIATRLTIR
jgi:hypothetical protein